MSNPLIKAPRLPSAPVEYDQRQLDALINTLRLYFNQLDNPGAILAATQNVDGKITTALSFSQPDPTTAGALIVSLPTQVDQAAGKLKTGDVYYDTTTFVLKVAP
jgi:type VI protein secretion system component VasK